MENKIVYVLIEHVPYEGYNEPEGVFTSEEKAWEYVEKLNKNSYNYSVRQYTVGEYE